MNKKMLFSGMDNVNVKHTHNGIELNCKEKQNLKFAGKWKNLENIISNEVAQSEKDNNHRFSFT